MNGIGYFQISSPPLTDTSIRQSFSRAGTGTDQSFLNLLYGASSKNVFVPVEESVAQDTTLKVDELLTKLVEHFFSEASLATKEEAVAVIATGDWEVLSDNLQLELQELLKTIQDLAGGAAVPQNYFNDPAKMLSLVVMLSQSNEGMELIPRLAQQVSQHEGTAGELASRAFMKDVQQLISELSSKWRLLEGKAVSASSGHLQSQTDRFMQIVSQVFSRTFNEQASIGTQGMALPTLGQGLHQLHQYALFVGDNRADQQSQEQLIRQFQNILGRSSMAQFPNGVSQLTIKLFPQHLGRLDVKLTQQNGVIVAQLLTTTKAAKAAIEGQLQQLRQAFIAQNIQVEKIEVNTQQQQTLQQSEKHSQDNSNREQSANQQKEEKEQENEASFAELLNETFDVEV